MRSKYFVIGLFSILFINSFGQSPGIISFYKSELFNQKNITAIKIDKLDNVWIGSSNGLFRFNGNSFQKIVFEPNCGIKDIFIDDNNDVYFIDNNSYIRVIRANNSSPEVILSTIRKRNIEPIKNSFYSINDTIKFTTTDNFVFKIFNGEVVDVKRESFKHYILKYFDNNKWTTRFLLTLHLTQLDSLIMKSKNTINSININYTALRAMVSFGNLFFLYTDSTVSFNKIDRSLKYVLTYDDNYCYTKNSNLYVKYNNDTVGKLICGNIIVNCIIEDNKNGIWIGTHRKGLMYIPNLNIHINKNATSFCSSNKNITQMSADSTYLIVHCDDTSGLYVNYYDKSKYLVKLKDKKYFFDCPFQINDCKIYNSKLWLASSSGLLRYNIKSSRNVLEFLGMNYGIPELNYRKVYYSDSVLHLISLDKEVYFNLKYCTPTYFSGFCIKSNQLEQLELNRYRLSVNDDDANNLEIYRFVDYHIVDRGGYVQYGEFGKWFDIKYSILNASSKNDFVLNYTINPYFDNLKKISIAVENSNVTQDYLLVIVVLIFIMFFVLIIRYMNKRAKESNQLSSIMQIVLQQQMSPHFIFNSLTSINHFVLKNKPIEGSRYLTKFSLFIRNILNNSVKSEISLYDELENLKIYLELEKLRFKERFDYEIIKDDYFDENQILIPPFIIQPFVEASLHLGILNRKEKGFIKISLKKNNSYFLCTIVDNGVGRQKAKLFEERNRTLSRNGAIAIAEKRIRLINNRNLKKIKLNIEDVENHIGEIEGSKFVLTIPLKIK